MTTRAAAFTGRYVIGWMRNERFSQKYIFAHSNGKPELVLPQQPATGASWGDLALRMDVTKDPSLQACDSTISPFCTVVCMGTQRQNPFPSRIKVHCCGRKIVIETARDYAKFYRIASRQSKEGKGGGGYYVLSSNERGEWEEGGKEGRREPATD